MEIIINQIKKHAKIARYLIAGGTAAFTDLALLYIFTDFVHIWYVISVVLAFIIAFGVSFGLQKFWTFRDNSMDKIHKQGFIYLFVAVVSLIVNTYAVYLLVSMLHIHYIISQIIVSAAIAVVNYFVYNKLIFRDRTVTVQL